MAGAPPGTLYTKASPSVGINGCRRLTHTQFYPAWGKSRPSHQPSLGCIEQSIVSKPSRTARAARGPPALPRREADQETAADASACHDDHGSRLAGQLPACANAYSIRTAYRWPDSRQKEKREVDNLSL